MDKSFGIEVLNEELSLYPKSEIFNVVFPELKKDYGKSLIIRVDNRYYF